MSEKITLGKEATSAPQQYYNPGVIQHQVNADKYTGVIAEKYIVTCPELGSRFPIKNDVLVEMARLDAKSESLNMLLRNGYEGSGKMSAGAGFAVKMTRTKDAYECIFYTGETGKAFDPKKLMSKDYISLDKKHLSALFTFLLCDEAVTMKLDATRKLENSSLELN